MDINTLHEKASSAFENGETEKAAELYNKILELVPNDEAALTSLMDLYQETDKLKYYLARANYNIVNGKLEYAINDCKKGLNVDPSNIEAREKLARLYRISDKPLKAIDEFSKIIEIDKQHLPSYFELIDLYSREKTLESALEVALRGVEVFGDEGNFKDAAAKLYMDLGEYKKALEIVQEDGLRIKILLQDEQNEEARKILEKIDINQNGFQPEQKALYCLLWAQYCYNTKKIQSAFNFIDKYTEILGPNPISFQMRALCYEELNDDFNASFNYGYMNKALGKFDEALVEFSQSYTLNPKNKDVLIELAKLYEQNKEKYTAIDFWQKVYELDEDETARSILADFYLKEGDTLMAEKYGATTVKNQGGASYDEPVEEDEGLLNKIIGFFSKK